ncbi:MAG: sialidase family protein [Acidobacteriota bacterium]
MTRQCFLVALSIFACIGPLNAQIARKTHRPAWVPNDIPRSIQVVDNPKFYMYLEKERGIDIEASRRRSLAEKLAVSGPFGESTRIGLPALSSLTSTTTPYSSQVTDEDEGEMETSIITLSSASSDWTIFGYMKKDLQQSVFTLHHATIEGTTNPWIYGDMTIPEEYEGAIDPVLGSNIYSSGVASKRVYYGGLLWQNTFSSEGGANLPNAVVVWRSDNYGQNWGSPIFVEENTDDATVFLDKPDLDVSQYSATRGYVFVSYTRLDLITGDGTDNEIVVARSTNGGASFTEPFGQPLATGLVTASQIVVNALTGRVYCLWADYDADEILMRYSDNNGSSWSNAEVVAESTQQDPMLLLGGGGDEFINGDVRTVSVLQARFNWEANKLAVTWHARDEENGDTDVYLALKGTQGGWTSPPIVVNQETENDQFQPALDFDDDGNFMVVFYDRSDDQNNVKYQERWVLLDEDGDFVQGETGYVADSFESDPTDFWASFMGDYQDIWFWNYGDVYGSRYHAAFTAAEDDGDEPDIYGSAIKP